MGRGLARNKQMGGGPKYGLQGVPKNSRVSALLDMKYRRRDLGTREGTIVARQANRVFVLWDGDEEPEMFAESDCRYWVDTDRWRITLPQNKRVL